MNKITIKSKKAMLAIKERVFNKDRFNNSDNHSIIITAIAILNTLDRSLLRASAESKKTNVKQRLYRSRCHSIGKKGIIKMVNKTSNNNRELLAVKNLLDTFERILIYKCPSCYFLESLSLDLFFLSDILPGNSIPDLI